MKTDKYSTEDATQELLRISQWPEPLRLAYLLEKEMLWPLHGKAADELRRLHAANLDCMEHFNALKAEHDELLATIIAAASLAHHETAAKRLLDEAIAKAEGGAA